jgi:pentatricopeptide repeat protein
MIKFTFKTFFHTKKVNVAIFGNYAYNAMIHGFNRLGKVGCAYSIFHDTSSNGCKPAPLTYDYIPNKW